MAMMKGFQITPRRRSVRDIETHDNDLIYSILEKSSYPAKRHRGQNTDEEYNKRRLSGQPVDISGLVDLY